MANVYCQVKSCKHRSSRRSQSKNKAGEWLYKCTKDYIVIMPQVQDEYDFEDKDVRCLGYSKKDD